MHADRTLFAFPFTLVLFDFPCVLQLRQNIPDLHTSRKIDSDGGFVPMALFILSSQSLLSDAVFMAFKVDSPAAVKASLVGGWVGSLQTPNTIHSNSPA